MIQRMFRNAMCGILCVLMMIPYILSVYAEKAADPYGTAEALVAQAVSQIDYYEENGGTTKYGAALGNEKLEKWDAAFIAWCASEAQIPDSIIPYYTGVPAMLNFFKLKGVYKPSAAYSGTYTPQSGDIVFISSEADKNNPSGVGIAESTDNTTVTVIEGNCPDRVARNVYDLADRKLIGYAAPKYQSVPAPSETDPPPAETTEYKPGTYRLDSNMNLRQSASSAADILTVIPEKTLVEIDEIKDVWGHTTFNGKTGWMSLENSTFLAESGQYIPGSYRTNFIMNFRSAPNTNALIQGTIPQNAVLNITETKDDWGKTTYSGMTGWLSLKYCSYIPDNPSPVIPIPEEMKVDWLILDISSYTEDWQLDWTKLKAAGIKGVILRIGGRGYGGSRVLYDDTAFYQHYLSAKAAGVYVGAYFFSYALTEAEAREEAQMTIDILRMNNCELDMPVFIDVEDYVESNGYDGKHERAGKAVCTAVADAFCKTIEEAGYYPGIYSSKYFLENLFDPSVFEGRALWVAHYASECGYKATPVGMWQYTDTGRISGYTSVYGSTIDINHCYVNYPALIRQIKENGQQTVTDPETPDKLWETVKEASCSENGLQNILLNDKPYVQRFIRAAHTGSTVSAVWIGQTDIHAGETFTIPENDEHYCTDSDERYAEFEEKARAAGGCKFSFCSDCREILRAEYYVPGSCDHSGTEETVKQADCASDGLTKTVCSVCGITESEAVLPKCEHTAGEPVFFKETSSSPAYSALYCLRCGSLLAASYGDFRILPGDADNSGTVEPDDARSALRYSVGLENIASENLINTDINFDGQTDAADARLILRKSVGLD